MPFAIPLFLAKTYIAATLMACAAAEAPAVNLTVNTVPAKIIQGPQPAGQWQPPAADAAMSSLLSVEDFTIAFRTVENSTTASTCLSVAGVNLSITMRPIFYVTPKSPAGSCTYNKSIAYYRTVLSSAAAGLSDTSPQARQLLATAIINYTPTNSVDSMRVQVEKENMYNELKPELYKVLQTLQAGFDQRKNVYLQQHPFKPDYRSCKQ